MNNTNDNNLMNAYIDIVPNLFLHFWGDMCILNDSNEGMQYRFKKVQTDILEFCCGKYTTEQIMNKIVIKYNCEKTDKKQKVEKKVFEFIKELVRVKFVITSKTPVMDKLIKHQPSGERGKYYPYSLAVEITSKCNFACPFCYKKAGTIGNDIPNNILNKILNLKGKVKEIRILGGEPLIYKGITKFINEAHNDFVVSMATNGSMVDVTDPVSLTHLDRLQFSMYGYSDDSYFNNTGSKIGWQKFKKAISIANENDVPYILCVTLGKEMIQYMEKYVLGAIEANAKRIKFGMPSPVGRAATSENTIDSYNFKRDEVRFAYYKMRELKLKYKDKINIAVWQNSTLFRQNAPVIFSECDGCLDCGGGWYSLVVSEGGKVRPCELLPEDIFTYGDFSVIQNIANNGYLYKNELYNMITRYKEIISQENIELKSVCPMLEKVDAKFKLA